MTLPDKKVEELLDEYKKDPVSFRLKYGATAEADLLETAHKKGMTKEVEKKTAKHGGKMKKKYQSQGEVRGMAGEGLAAAELYGEPGREPSEIKRGESSSLSEVRAKVVQGHLGQYDTVAKMRKYLFEQNGPITHGEIESRIRMQVAAYMPFVKILNISFNTPPEIEFSGNFLSIGIEYFVTPLQLKTKLEIVSEFTLDGLTL